MTVEKRLRTFVDSLPVADGHEHYLTPQQLRQWPGSFVQTAAVAYLRDDAISLGAPPEKARRAASEAEAWEIYGPRLPQMRNTGYYRAMAITLRHFYDADIPKTRNEWMDLAARVRDRYNSGDQWYFRTIRQEMNCRVISWAPLEGAPPDIENPDPTLFRRNTQGKPAYHEAYPCSEASRKDYFDKYGCEPKSVDELLDHYRRTMIQERDEWALVSIKRGDAYDRGINFRNIGRREAEKVFEKGIRSAELSAADELTWRDFFVFRQGELAAELGLTFQVHTGILASAAGDQDIRKTDPLLLHELLSANPQTTFELFHGGYPFTDHYTLMGRMYPNVVLNLCWLHYISPAGYERTLGEALDTVAYTKIIAFGGDTRCPEASWAGLQLAKQGAARVACRKVAEGALSEQVARDVLMAIFHDNGMRLWA